MNNIRNVAIIAHVDHGKTTLVDALLRQTQTRLGKAMEGHDLIMDSNELERERGITIFSKNVSVVWKGTKLNIIDTPGHADFGGEVERVLTMADGCLLLVDAKEGPMPQTRFVLKQALKMGLKLIVVINKVDKPDARPAYVLDKTLELFIELGADDRTIDFPVVYAVAKNGLAGATPDISAMRDISPIFDSIIHHVPAPLGDFTKPLQMLVTTLATDSFKGRIAIGRVYHGTVRTGQQVVHINRVGEHRTLRLTSVMAFEGLGRVEADSVPAGDLVALAGIPDITIGETVADADAPQALPLLDIEEPTVKVTFSINDSPFAGREGKFTTSRQIRERLMRELETDVALRVTDLPDSNWEVAGRGELHLAILIERLRREGYELQVSQPQVINRVVDGKVHTPFERVFAEVPEAYGGSVIQAIGARYGELREMRIEEGTTYLEFSVPTRGLFGYRTEFLSSTRGLGILNTTFFEYQPEPGSFRSREQGSMVAHETGETNLYGLLKVQDQGTLFVGAGVKVYKGQVVGQGSRDRDMSVNVCKVKQLSNMRSKGDGGQEHFKAPHTMDLEEALEYLGEDELVEVTPKSVRIRKRILDEAEARRRELGVKS